MSAMILCDALVASMRANARATISTPRETRSFAELLLAADATAQALEQTLPGPRSRVLVTAPNSPEYVSLFLALLAGGHLPVLADPILARDEVDDLIRGCGIDAIVTSAPDTDLRCAVATEALALDHRHWLHAADHRGPRPTLAEDTELGRLTSGSTRTPACIEFSGRAVISAARTWAGAAGLSPSDTSLCYAGLYNGLAFNTTLIPSLLVGANIALSPAPPTAGSLLRHVRAFDPTVLVAFPAAYELITAFPSERVGDDLRGLRLLLSSAAPLPAATAAHIESIARPICNYYGIAEVGPVTIRAEDDDEPDSLGAPLPGVAVESREIADGTKVIHVRTASMGTKYLNYPGELERQITPDGYFTTSDTGELTDGLLRLRGRTNQRLNIAGRKFGADSIRSAVLEFPGVLDCHVTQVTTPSRRDCVGAVIESRAALDITALREHLRGRIAEFKVPEVVLTTDCLPRSTSGKPRTADITAMLAETFTAPTTEDA
ncbi:MAG TPA: class I adenylate-forming enzyme family protein [Gordonia sp. (in: high G+C Gram-positive bacteria)]|uniref:class I adenylate-forming enzyme family protein n=1 Tax=unclassified Gordonia (in: high G+C Gram-positive bacteria) TaxID=2657482 RepID=UPI000FAD1DEE|nr:MULTISPECIES: class I adenylate-forming enzyme family protein [unclassified Gordonia (in: high G+C Gram-positive bacteria)]RUP37615.1 MAG: long-chain fatty acid--CoA ligase [Gordonia sp. (in: high G+C Gram-positive bacteria)]HNP58493.1 class I adenylate-forming enzyme family protein [Gordonia sp. (in: high G+C Gram-positive bacteria)]HRC51466.1 class I adenylate-forming enzyme family protein [Gordonia sp. (in: high G+C Gram-positive bacteria)]